VLSDAAHRALLDLPVGTGGLEGVFAFEGGGMSGEFAMAPGAAPGSVRVTLDLHRPAPAEGETSAGAEPPMLHIEAQVQESWLRNVSVGAEDHGQQVARIVEALAGITRVPGQQTVHVAIEGAPGAGPPAAEHSLPESVAAVMVQPLAGLARPLPPPGSVDAREPLPEPGARSFDEYGPKIRGPVRPRYPQVWLPAEYPPPPDDPSLIAILRPPSDGRQGETAAS